MMAPNRPQASRWSLREEENGNFWMRGDGEGKAYSQRQVWRPAGDIHGNCLPGS